jgi:hypothetical protein
VPSAAMLRAAGSRALVAESRSRLVTRSLHAELVFNLSGSKHITDALKRWGVAPDTTAVLMAAFDASAADLQLLRGLVQGVEVEVGGGAGSSVEEAVASLADAAATKKVRAHAGPTASPGYASRPAHTTCRCCRFAHRACSRLEWFFLWAQPVPVVGG